MLQVVSTLQDLIDKAPDAPTTVIKGEPGAVLLLLPGVTLVKKPVEIRDFASVTAVGLTVRSGQTGFLNIGALGIFDCLFDAAYGKPIEELKTEIPLGGWRSLSVGDIEMCLIRHSTMRQSSDDALSAVNVRNLWLDGVICGGAKPDKEWVQDRWASKGILADKCENILMTAVEVNTGYRTPSIGNFRYAYIQNLRAPRVEGPSAFLNPGHLIITDCIFPTKPQNSLPFQVRGDLSKFTISQARNTVAGIASDVMDGGSTPALDQWPRWMQKAV